MEERMAAAPVDRNAGRAAYHAFTYGWLTSGLARAITGKGMRELFRSEIAKTLNTDGLHLGRPRPMRRRSRADHVPPDDPGQPAVRSSGTQTRELSVAGGMGAMYVPGITSLIQGDTPFLDSEIPSVNAVVTARGLAKMYGARPTTARSTEHNCYQRNWPAAAREA